VHRILLTIQTGTPSSFLTIRTSFTGVIVIRVQPDYSTDFTDTVRQLFSCPSDILEKNLLCFFVGLTTHLTEENSSHNSERKASFPVPVRCIIHFVARHYRKAVLCNMYRYVTHFVASDYRKRVLCNMLLILQRVTIGKEYFAI
jgi:hypothetical protein